MKNRKALYLFLFLFSVLMIIIGIYIYHETDFHLILNKSNDSFNKVSSIVVENNKIDGFTFLNATLIYSKEKSKISVEVTNTLKTVTYVKSLGIFVKDMNNGVIAYVFVDIDSMIAVNETKIVIGNFDTKLTDVYTLEYIINY